MQRQLRVANAHGGHLAKSGLKRGHELGLQHGVQPVPPEFIGNVSADILIEEDGVTDPVGILAEAPDGHRGAETDILIHYPEGHRSGGAVLIAVELLGVDVIDPLVLARVSAEGEPAAKGGEAGLDALPQGPGEDAGLGGGIVDEFARLGADLRDLPLIHDQHTLTVRHGDHGAVGDDVIAALVGRPGGHPLAPLYRQNRFRQSVTVKILLPLVSQNAARGRKRRFDKTHNHSLL